ncbi:MAG: hypothetical protein KDN05_03580 [Verrucomicrobiae bacterium]|nr:hypothetical protein [Verrucomicrobiae bacterium]
MKSKPTGSNRMLLLSGASLCAMGGVAAFRTAADPESAGPAVGASLPSGVEVGRRGPPLERTIHARRHARSKRQHDEIDLEIEELAGILELDPDEASEIRHDLRRSADDESALSIVAEGSD